ncbi:Rieske 2Fe-2S domain-containing protein [Streptomyces sp. NPDC007905]|uniref:Rieske (2Fe-2S) protein n=1 Tax=Streptomyces sp. NPDC007905 TaxID=3364788 RepID=UPI0036E66487
MTYSTTRRTVMATGAAALAVSCGGNTTKGSSTNPSTSPSSSPSGASSSPSTSPSSSSSAKPSAPGGQELTRTSDIPEGGGRVFKAQKVVVTQPKKGDFKAFSAICTHEGCLVNQVADGTIDCPCHGSRYHIADGAVAHGPATLPLAPETIMVEGNSIRLA